MSWSRGHGGFWIARLAAGLRYRVCAQGLRYRVSATEFPHRVSAPGIPLLGFGVLVVAVAGAVDGSDDTGLFGVWFDSFS